MELASGLVDDETDSQTEAASTVEILSPRKRYCHAVVGAAETVAGAHHKRFQVILEEHEHPLSGKLIDPLLQCKQLYEKYLPAMMKTHAAFWMRDICHHTILFRIKSRVLSCCTFELHDNQYAELYLLATAESERRHGFAKRIVGQIVKLAGEASCKAVIASVSKPAIPFFRNIGFTSAKETDIVYESVACYHAERMVLLLTKDTLAKCRRFVKQDKLIQHEPGSVYAISVAVTQQAS